MMKSFVFRPFERSISFQNSTTSAPFLISKHLQLTPSWPKWRWRIETERIGFFCIWAIFFFRNFSYLLMVGLSDKKTVFETAFFYQVSWLWPHVFISFRLRPNFGRLVFRYFVHFFIRYKVLISLPNALPSLFFLPNKLSFNVIHLNSNKYILII